MRPMSTKQNDGHDADDARFDHEERAKIGRGDDDQDRRGQRHRNGVAEELERKRLVDEIAATGEQQRQENPLREDVDQPPRQRMRRGDVDAHGHDGAEHRHERQRPALHVTPAESPRDLPENEREQQRPDRLKGHGDGREIEYRRRHLFLEAERRMLDVECFDVEWTAASCSFSFGSSAISSRLPFNSNIQHNQHCVRCNANHSSLIVNPVTPIGTTPSFGVRRANGWRRSLPRRPERRA